MSGIAFRPAGSVPVFTGADGATIEELAGRSTGLTSHSVAIITHPVGMSTVEHHHTVADEVYYVQSGTGRIRINGETRAIGPGDTIMILPGERHKLWADGEEDLVLVVTCAPAYEVTEVIWDE
jgi:mannose-6-phosphate isomerase-like protein (cupin superfamily)